MPARRAWPSARSPAPGMSWNSPRVQGRTADLQRVNTRLRAEITERRRAEKALAQLSRQHQLILETAGEGIYGVDRQGTVTFINPAAAQMLGWEVKALIGQVMHDR